MLANEIFNVSIQRGNKLSEEFYYYFEKDPIIINDAHGLHKWDAPYDRINEFLNQYTDVNERMFLAFSIGRVVGSLQSSEQGPDLSYVISLLFKRVKS